jgi:hypothetical protein
MWMSVSPWAEARAVRQFEVRRAQVQDEVVHKHTRGAAFGKGCQILLAASSNTFLNLVS